MVDAIKKMDKKFLIMVGAIIVIPIVIIILLAIIQGCGNRKVSYEKYEDKMVQAATKYFKSKGNPKNESEIKTLQKDICNGSFRSNCSIFCHSGPDGFCRTGRLFGC